MRKTGIDVIGNVPWGTHMCQFYKTQADLIDILVPYVKAGLESNELCMWVTSEPLEVAQARKALLRAVGNLSDYIDSGQIQILDAGELYTKSGKFESERVLQGWVDKEKEALKRGYDGLRLTGNTFWLHKRTWRDFSEYEAEIDRVIGDYRMIVICSYALDKCGAVEVVDVVDNHCLSLIRRDGQWVTIQSAKRARVEEQLKDITERKKVEEQLKTLLKEKEALLSEVNHRVKNNFQLISSLLDMVGMRARNEETIRVCASVHARVHAMGLIHSQLYQSGSFAQIDMEAHVKELVGYLAQVYATNGIKITPVIDASGVYLSITPAVPCALALNEIISNAFKHAFQGRQKGTIEISLRKSAEGMVTMRVKDDGIGMPEDFDIDKTSTLGLKLTRNLVQEQLKGSIQFRRGNGTEVIIEFKVG